MVMEGFHRIFRGVGERCDEGFSGECGLWTERTTKQTHRSIWLHFPQLRCTQFAKSILGQGGLRQRPSPAEWRLSIGVAEDLALASVRIGGEVADIRPSSITTRVGRPRPLP